MREEILKVEDLTKHFGMSSFFSFKRGAEDVLKAVDGINFSINKGEAFGLVGESGSGKSTTARLITRLIDATGGRISFSGQEILEMSQATFQSVRRRIQMVFQDANFIFCGSLGNLHCLFGFFQILLQLIDELLTTFVCRLTFRF